MTLEKKAQRTYEGGGDDIEALVRRFEDCTLASSDFKHAEHLVVALWYLVELKTVEAACERMRAALFRFLAHHSENPQLYNETVTLFWLKRVRSFLDAQRAGASLGALADAILESCGGSGVIKNYYSPELLASDAARTAWAEPDLRALDF